MSNQALLLRTFCTWPVKRLEQACPTVLHEGGSVAGSVNCAPWLECGMVENRAERGLSLSEVTCCYNSHILPVGSRTMLHLLPLCGPRLTFWPINLQWTRSQRITSHWKFGVYQGFDLTRAEWTCGPPCVSKAAVKLSSWIKHSDEWLYVWWILIIGIYCIIHCSL